jgi:hypothetical protein
MVVGALARLHAAGDGGLVLEAHSFRRVPQWERCPSWSTVVRFRNRKIPYAAPPALAQGRARSQALRRVTR